MVLPGSDRRLYLRLKCIKRAEDIFHTGAEVINFQISERETVEQDVCKQQQILPSLAVLSDAFLQTPPYMILSYNTTQTTLLSDSHSI